MFLNQFLAVKKDVIAGVYLGILRILSSILYRTPPGDAQKMKFSIKDFFSKCEEITEEILNGKLHFLCSGRPTQFLQLGQNSKVLQCTRASLL